MVLDCAEKSEPLITAVAMNYLYGILRDKGMPDVLHRMPLPPQPTRAARSTAAASRDHASLAKAGAAWVSHTTAATLV